jgi:hypothetical protein
MASVTIERGSRLAWTGTTSLRALEAPDEMTRRAATLYDATQLRLRLDFVEAYVGDLHLYLLDWDTTARRATVTVLDGSGSRSYNATSPFSSGLWLHVPVEIAPGQSLVVSINRTGGTNAVLSGLFLGGAGDTPPVPPDPSYEQGVQGNWVGGYGHDGFAIGAWNGTTDLVSLSNATLSVEQGARTRWTKKSTTNARALENSAETERRATTWYHAAQVRLRLTFEEAYAGVLHIYVLDWDTTARRETVSVDDGATTTVVNVTTAFDAGAWIHFPISVPDGGSVFVTADRTAGANAVISGFFLGGS